jgi:hypothetical protein
VLGTPAGGEALCGLYQRPSTQSAVAMQRAALLLATLGAGAATTCDLFEKGGTPCVAAHSTVRALFGAYKGALYQVKRADGQLLDVKVANGFAAAAAQVQTTPTAASLAAARMMR